MSDTNTETKSGEDGQQDASQAQPAQQTPSPTMLQAASSSVGAKVLQRKIARRAKSRTTDGGSAGTEDPASPRRAIQRAAGGDGGRGGGGGGGNSMGYQWSSGTGQPEAKLATPSSYTTSYTEPNQQVTGSKSLEEVRKDVDGIGTKATQNQGTQASGNVKFGTFANASLKVNVPIPQVPGLSIAIEFEGKYARFQDGEQELELRQAIGVEWSFFDIFTVHAKEFQYLKLEGKNLGDAFVDAVKQVTRRILINSGVEKELAHLASWKQLSTVEKIADLGSDLFQYGPLSPLVSIPKLMSSTASSKQIKGAYAAYCEFFKNNAAVGFEVGIGVSVGAEADLGELGAAVSFEAIAGIEDVGRVKAVEFAEVAATGGGKVLGSEVKFRLGKRWRADGTQRLKFEMEGVFPGVPGASKQVTTGVKAFLKSGACLAAFGETAATDKEGDGGEVDIAALAQTAAAVIPIKGAKQKMGLDLGLENTIGGGKSSWKANARIKEMQAFDNELGAGGVGVEMKLQYGSFIDISGEIETYLNTLQTNFGKQAGIGAAPTTRASAHAGVGKPTASKFPTLKAAYADYCAAVPKPYRPIAYAKFAEICKTPANYERARSAFLKPYGKK